MYASAELVFRPDLRHTSVVVASNGDGIVVAANRQALELGVKKFKPVFEYRHLFDSGKCTLFSSNYRLYDALSSRFIQCLDNGGLFSRIEKYSIDELFGDIPSCITDPNQLFQLARQARRAVWDEVRLPIGVGIGRSFSLAKCASYVGKKVAGYRGICVLTPENEEDTLKLVPVNEIWNVGRATTTLLKNRGIYTALDLRRMSLVDARGLGGANLQRTVTELQGNRVFTMDSFPDVNTRKEVSSSISLTVRAKSPIELHQSLSNRIATAAEKLRKLGFTTRHMILFARTSAYDTSSQVNNQVSEFFEYPIDDTRVLIRVLTERFHELYEEGTEFYKIGCRLLGLELSKQQQFDLFAPTQSSELMKVMDSLNEKFGAHIVTVAAQKTDTNAVMLRNHLSQNYLTDWKDLPIVRC